MQSKNAHRAAPEQPFRVGAQPQLCHIISKFTKKPVLNVQNEQKN